MTPTSSLTFDSFPWYAIRVRSRHEKIAYAGLTGKGYSPFLPLYTSSRRSSGPEPSKLPFFPGYLFCRFDPAKILPILTTVGVVSVVHNGRTPVPVDESEINSVKTLVASGLTPRTCTYISEGEKVIVEAGPLQGVEGIFIRGKNVASVVISIALLQRSISVEVPREFVSAIRHRGISIAGQRACA